ncbi:hypothetical protein HN954_00180 [bacterium]|jgi:hypothetical protein|nr:hypothetical protein [bacterium]MBT6832053.1 hypothetical protein [bacterium]MBT6995834.1 hypothetical protein [bacterium]MBT7772355.1 hypothetical protein [bacterium]
MKHKKILGIVLVIVVIVAAFFARELWLGRTQLTQIFSEKNVMLVRAPEGKIFFFGEESVAKNAAWNIRPFLLGEKMQNIFSSPVGDEIVNPTFTVQRLSTRFVRGLFSNDLGGRRAAFFFFDENFSEDELAQINIHRTRLQSDWWVMQKNVLPDFLPAPRRGIIFLGERAPSEKTTKFATDHDLSLISVSETGGFSLEFENDDWAVKTRK